MDDGEEATLALLGGDGVDAVEDVRALGGDGGGAGVVWGGGCGEGGCGVVRGTVRGVAQLRCDGGGTEGVCGLVEKRYVCVLLVVRFRVSLDARSTN